MYQFKWFWDCCAQGWLLILGLYSSKISSQIIIVLPHSKEVTNSQTVHIKQKLISLLVLLSAFCSQSFPHSFSIYRTCKSQNRPFSITLPPFRVKPTQIFHPHTMFLLIYLYLSNFCTPCSFSSYNYIKIFDLFILLCLSIICHLVHSFIHLFNGYLLSTYYVAGTGQCIGQCIGAWWKTNISQHLVSYPNSVSLESNHTQLLSHYPCLVIVLTRLLPWHLIWSFSIHFGPLPICSPHYMQNEFIRFKSDYVAYLPA